METIRFLLVSTHFPPHHLGGDAVFVQYLSEELARRGHEVHVFHNPAVYKLLRKGERNKDAEDSAPGVVKHPLSAPGGRYEPALALSFGWWGRAKTELDDLAKTLKPDVVHWHNTRGFIGRPYSFPSSVSLFTVHDYTPVCPRSDLLRPGMRLCEEARLCALCCIRWRKPPHLWRLGRRRVVHPDPGVKVIAPSEFLANRIRREGVAVHQVLRNFVPDHGHDPNQKSAEANTLLYLGLLERHKGVHVLVDAFCRSSDEHGFRLLIVGDGNLREELRMMVRRAGMDERVAITGHLRREEVEGLRKKVAAQIVPSTWYENAPLTVLEAFSFGIPVIASDIGGLGEIAVQEAGSETFRSGDNLELSERIIELWSHKESLRERSRKAREAYVKRFSPDVHIASYVRIINDLQSK